jgi:restriction system protein
LSKGASMARRKKTTFLDDVFQLVAMLPWWAGVMFAVFSYGVLHHYATIDFKPVGGMDHLSSNIISGVSKQLASFAQYIFPLVALAGALASFMGRRKREGLVSTVADNKSNAVVSGMSWKDFELLVGEGFRLKGYTVVENGGGGADGGIDLSLKKDGEVFLVQCKQWRAYKVSVSIVRELFGVMVAHGAAGGFVVTSGVFTEDARKFALGRNIELIDGTALAAMISQAKTNRSKPAMMEKAQTPEPSTGTASPSVVPVSVPLSFVSCPLCGGAMVKRIAKQGPNSGNSFWGCKTFPKCRGVLPDSK